MTTMYEPQQFSQLFKTELGQAVWSFLNEDDALIRMETASYLSRPALEALSPVLERRFGKAVFEDRMKQMTGHMVRQIHEAYGYRLDRTGVRITTDGNGYSTAARYIPASPHDVNSLIAAKSNGSATDLPQLASPTSSE